MLKVEKNESFRRSRKAGLMHVIEGAETYRLCEESRGFHLIFADNDVCSIPQPLPTTLYSLLMV